MIKKRFSIAQEWRTILWVIIPVYLLANIYFIIYLINTGEGLGIMALLFANLLYLILMASLTAHVTRPLPAEEMETSKSLPRIWAQIGALAVIILLTQFRSGSIPLWSPLVDWFYNLGESTLSAEWFGGPGNSIANPVQLFVIPFIVLLLLGARPAELGFGRGNKVWRACLVWLALPTVIWAILLVMGMLPAQTLARHLISNLFQNGFFEEFLYRGALQTRLRKVMSLPWALTLQAFIFGLTHMDANTQMLDGNILAGLAFCIISQTVTGFVFGFVFYRTRNLVAPTVAHVAMNALGRTF